MEIILLGIYAFFAWLVFFKFKWLPWNITTQVITITLPIIGLKMLILMLNIVAPSSADVRVINYVVPINPPVRGLVTEVPIEPNSPIKKGDVLFQIDPTPYEISVKSFEAQIDQLQAQLVTARANSQNFEEQLKSATGQKEAIQAQLTLARLRLEQFQELAETSYRVGKSDLRAVQQQLISLQSSRQALLRVESESLSQRTTLHLAVGGNFEQPVGNHSSIPNSESSVGDQLESGL